jgi:predicted short-subunit dehydrogenase-like oxidoreductase (DUF2520 family)
MSDKAVEQENVRIHVGVEEKIGLPQYSSATITASLSRVVADGDEAYLDTELRKVAQIVENFVAEERQALLKSVQESQAGNA